MKSAPTAEEARRRVVARPAGGVLGLERRTYGRSWVHCRVVARPAGGVLGLERRTYGEGWLQGRVLS